MGDPPFRHNWPPLFNKGDSEDPHPTRHEQRLSAIATVARLDSRAGDVVKRWDFLGLGRKRTARLLGLSEQTISRRRTRFWLALQLHVCGLGCEECDSICRRT